MRDRHVLLVQKEDEGKGQVGYRARSRLTCDDFRRAFFSTASSMKLREKFLVRRMRALVTPALTANPRDGLVVDSALLELCSPGARRRRRQLLAAIGGQLVVVFVLATALQTSVGGDARMRQLLALDVCRLYAGSVPVAMVLLYLCVKSWERLAWTAPLALLVKVHYASVSRTIASTDFTMTTSADVSGVQASLLLAWVLLLYPIHRLQHSTPLLTPTRVVRMLSLVLFTVVQSVLLASLSVDGASSALLHCGVLASSLLVAVALTGVDWSEHVTAFEAPSTLVLGCGAHGVVTLFLLALSALSRARCVSAEGDYNEDHCDSDGADDPGLAIVAALVAQLPTALLVSCEVATLQRFMTSSKADAPVDVIAFLYTEALVLFLLLALVTTPIALGVALVDTAAGFVVSADLWTIEAGTTRWIMKRC